MVTDKVIRCGEETGKKYNNTKKDNYEKMTDRQTDRKKRGGGVGEKEKVVVSKNIKLMCLPPQQKTKKQTNKQTKNQTQRLTLALGRVW